MNIVKQVITPLETVVFFIIEPVLPKIKNVIFFFIIIRFYIKNCLHCQYDNLGYSNVLN